MGHPDPSVSRSIAAYVFVNDRRVGRRSILAGDRHRGGERTMEESRTQQATLARLASVIERAAGDLSLAEEPARFIAALEGEGDPEGAG
jgi:hypothetical protein